MKKNLFLAAIMLSAGGLMTACGTAETTEENANSTAGEQTAEEKPSTEAETPEAEAETEAETETETSEAPAEEAEAGEETEASDSTGSDEASTEEEAESIPEEDVAETTPEEGSSQAETEGTLTPSDEQPYQIRVVRGYELTSEEPGKDSLFLSEDSSVFMRIETFAKSDMTFDQAASSLKETVQASNAEAEMTEVEAPQGAALLNSVAYEVPTAEGKVTGIVFEKEDIIARLTLFDSTDATATEDFIDMAKTIEPKE